MFVSLFRSYAAANPAKTAVVCRSGAIRYGEMAGLVRRVSKYLSLMGVEQGSRVVVALPASINTLVLYHALADSGAVIVPLSRDLSLDAIRECLEDARPQFCLVPGKLALPYQQVCAGLGQGQVVSDSTRPYSLEDMFRRDPACIRPLPVTGPDHELIIHYYRHQGQGGRGCWSGVVQTHGSLIQRLLNWSVTAALGASDSTLCMGAMSDPLVTETLALAALATGQTLYLMEEEEAAPETVVRLIRQQEIGILGAPPAFYQKLLDIPPSGGAGVRHPVNHDQAMSYEQEAGGKWCRIKSQDLRSLRLALCDAGSLKKDLAPAFQRRYGLCLNYAFSLPEAPLALVDFAPGEGSEAIAIGRPIAGVEACVQGLAPEQDGVGELWLRSQQFAECSTRGQPLCNARGWLPTGVLVNRRGGRFYLLGQPPTGVGEPSGVYLPA